MVVEQTISQSNRRFPPLSPPLTPPTHTQQRAPFPSILPKRISEGETLVARRREGDHSAVHDHGVNHGACTLAVVNIAIPTVTHIHDRILGRMLLCPPENIRARLGHVILKVGVDGGLVLKEDKEGERG